MGQFAKLRGYPAVDDHTVTAPNADTLYTVLWLDVSKEPWIISAPDMKGRFFLLPMLDGWTTVFADPGKRTTGTAAQKFAITGPGWTGTLPAGVTEYKSPPALCGYWVGSTAPARPEDYKAVHALQDQMTAVPLSSYGKPYTAPPGVVDPNIDMKTSIRDQVNAMDAASYFKLARRVDEGESANRGGCADGGEAREDRPRARGRISMHRSSILPSPRASRPRPSRHRTRSWYG